MPEVKNIRQAEVVFLYTNIGRGHPMYLDGIIDVLKRQYPDYPFYSTDVFAICAGPSILAWKLVRLLYRFGARGGIVSAMYNTLRRVSGSGDGAALQSVLGKAVLRWAEPITVPIVVAHPILAKILAPHKSVIYQHGELAVPDEAIVRGCQSILVPTEEAAARFAQAGIKRDDIQITGQCIEPELRMVAETAYQKRLNRIQAGSALTVGFFSSGAYPKDHIRLIKTAVVACVRAGHRAVVFTGLSTKMLARLKEFFDRQFMELAGSNSTGTKCRVIGAATRAEDNHLAAELMSELDIVVAPAHERTNWAVGLGLPMVLLGPHIGSFAPLNAGFALDKRVVVEVSTVKAAIDLPVLITSLRRNGELQRMAVDGYRADRIDGFERAADIIASL